MKFPYTTDNKRYHTLHHHNLQIYGGKVFKASLDCGMTCPNRDGTLGRGGCIFCDSGSRYFGGTGSVVEQIMAERQRIRQKWPNAGLIAYFQAGTNTYGPAEYLATLWEQALGCPGVVGISIATRADCLNRSVLEALADLNRRTRLTVELGLQTAHDETAAAIGRGHSMAQFLEGYGALRERKIRICVHLINGLPGETEEMMLESARQVGRLQPGGVKLHLLHVNRETALAELWRQGIYRPMEKEDYVRVVTEQLRYLPAETVIERLTGDGDRNRLLAPLWSRNKISVLGAIDKRMCRENIWQGDCYEKV